MSQLLKVSHEDTKFHFSFVNVNVEKNLQL